MLFSPVQISFMQIIQDLLLRSGIEGSFSYLRCKKLPCAAYCQQQNPYDSFLCPHKTFKWKQNFQDVRITFLTGWMIYYTTMNIYSAVTGFRGSFILYLTWIMHQTITVPNFQFGIFVVAQLNICRHIHVTYFSTVLG